MKIWLDLRFLWDNIYSRFVLELVKWFISLNTENSFIIYTNISLRWFDFPNTEIKNICIKNKSFKEQTTYYKILKKDKNNLMIFFNHYKPIFYTWLYITFLHTLKEIYYSNFSNYYNKYNFLYLLEKNLKKSTKIICFDNNTHNELIEKFNIEENKINILQWFFPLSNNYEELKELKINIRMKYNLVNDFLIYSGWEWVEKNYDKLIYTFDKLKKNWKQIDLVILWETISRNIPLRNLILNLDLQKNIHFMWVIKESEKVFFYENSLWVIFPSLYEPFPFRLSEPLYYDTPVIASDLKNIKNIFWNSISYFSPLSVNSMYEQIEKYLEEKNHIVNYEDIKNKYNRKNTIKELLEIIK